MIYKLDTQKDDQIQSYYDSALKELNEFYGINWVRNKPRLILVSDRSIIDSLFEKETEGWIVGWSENRNIFVLDKNKIESESSHKKYSDEDYAMLIKHEMSHTFSSILSKGEVKPKWFWEGVAIYTAGQNSTKQKPSEFKEFLEFFDNGGKDVYGEAGFAVQLLVEKFGKQKILELLKDTSKFKTVGQFSVRFHKLFGFEATYAGFNALL